MGRIKTTIVDYYRTERKEYVTIFVPVQDVVNSVLVLEVLEGGVGHITYTGQKWISEGVVRRGLGIKPGDPLIESDFLNDVTFFNRNPFHHTQMVMVPQKETGVTDLTFVTEDRFPARFYVGSDNTGYLLNNTCRLYGGFNWGDAFMIGDLLSYQYTAAPNFHDFQSHTANYTSFLPTKHILTVFGTYAIVYPIVPGFAISGICIQGSGRYQIPIRPFYGIFRNHLEFGFDWKYITSNEFYTGNITEITPTTTQTITVSQFLFSYEMERNWPQHLFVFQFDTVVSPWRDLFPHQSSSDYNALRGGSHVRYAYWRVALSDLYRTAEGVTLSWLVRGQLATGTLPTSEQFGLGGEDTVRGYYEQQFIADNAFCANIEVYTPKYHHPKFKLAELSLLAFFDYGYGYNYTAITPTYIKQNLIGIGPGIRFAIPPYLNVKMDYGFQVIGVPGDNRFGRFHYSAVASY